MSAGARRRAAKAGRAITLKVLRRLLAGPAHLEPEADAVRLISDVAAGPVLVPAATFRALERADLVRCDAAGRAALTASGRAFLKRALAGDDGFLAQHREIAERQLMNADGRAVSVTVNLRESPLAWLATRRDASGQRLVTPAQFEAGERLRADHAFGAITPGLTSTWRDASMPGRGAAGSGDQRDLSDAALAARQRVERALVAVGPELSGVLLDVCCHLKGLSTVEAERRWPPRSAKIVLGLALDRLAAHYGLGPGRRDSGGDAMPPPVRRGRRCESSPPSR